MKNAVIAVLWMLTGVLLWMRAMRVYGPNKWFVVVPFSDEFGVEEGKPGQHLPMPSTRLWFHIIFAPLVLAGAAWYNGPWALIRKISDYAERFAAWYAPASDEESES